MPKGKGYGGKSMKDKRKGMKKPSPSRKGGKKG